MTRGKITPEAADEFVARFNGFNDGLIRQMVVRFCGSVGRSAFIECSTIDLIANDWCNVVLKIGGLSAFRASEGRTSHVVLSDGIKFTWLDGRCYVDLAPYTSAPVGLEDLERSAFLPSWTER